MISLVKEITAVTCRYIILYLNRYCKFLQTNGHNLTDISIILFQKKESFIGRQALEVQKRDGISQRIVQLTLTDLHLDHDIWPWGGEPIYRNGQCVGSVTSCGFNFNLEKVVCLGYVDVRPLTNAGHLEHATDATTIYKLDIGSRLYDLDVHEV